MTTRCLLLSLFAMFLLFSVFSLQSACLIALGYIIGTSQSSWWRTEMNDRIAILEHAVLELKNRMNEHKCQHEKVTNE